MSTALLERPQVSGRRTPASRLVRPAHPTHPTRPARPARPGRRARRQATLRARRLLASLLVVALVCLGVWSASALHSQASSDVDTVAATVVVGPGDTVWALAEDYRPAGVDTHTYVARVLRHNDIDAAAVRPGTVLQLPRD